jgi:hypothetical protein
MSGKHFRRPVTVGPVDVQRQDRDDGYISYELWDTNPDTYHRICSVDEDDNSDAKHDSELLARALNHLLGQPS